MDGRRILAQKSKVAKASVQVASHYSLSKMQYAVPLLWRKPSLSFASLVMVDYTYKYNVQGHLRISITVNFEG